MGYYVSYQHGNAKFSIKKKDEVLQAIKNLHGKETIHDASGRHFSWINNDFYKINDIEKMFSEWRWGLEIDATGSYFVITEFLGEKLGDDDIFFECIAPYMEDGYIEMCGEDSQLWRWVFQNGTVKEISPNISWNYEQ